MSSSFSVLTCRDTLISILEKVPLADLARAACVCKTWQIIASDRDMQIRAFGARWNLKEVIGKPSSGSFWRDTTLSKFAISHSLLRTDSLTSLAVKYSLQVIDIKRLNNMMSDHGIHSRERLLIPVTNPDLLCNATCYIEVDKYAKREVAVVYPDGGPNREQLSSIFDSMASDQGKRRVVDSLKRSMQVDDGTVQYYLSISNGDPRGALSQFSEDLKWERQVGLA